MTRLPIALGSMLLLSACSAPCPAPTSPPPCPPCNCSQAPAAQSVAKPATTDPPLVVAVNDPPESEPSSADTTVVVAPQADWSQFQGDGSRAGRSSAPAILRPSIRWKAQVGIQGYLNAPIISGATVFVPSSGNVHNASDPRDGVYAIELGTGRRQWHAHFDNDANGLALAGQRLIATSDDGHVYGLDATRGTVVWKRKGKGKMYSYPAIIDDIVVVGDAQGYVRAYAWADGTERWSIQMNGAIRGGLSTDGTYVYVASQGGEVAAFRKNGQARWRKTVSRPAFSGGQSVPIEGYAPPIVSGNDLIVPFARDTTYDDPAFIALDKGTGRVRWRAQDNSKANWGNLRSTPALIDGLLVYAEPYSGDVAAVEAATGRVKYRREVGPCHFPQYASAASAGHLVYVPRFDGTLYAVQARTGQVAWQMYLGDATSAGATTPSRRARRGCSWDVSSGHPLYAPIAIAGDGTVVVGSGEGTVFAIGSM